MVQGAVPQAAPRLAAMSVEASARLAQPASAEAVAGIDPNGTEATSLIKTLIAHHVALTSTLAVADVRVAGVPKQPEVALQLLTPQSRASYEQGWANFQKSPMAKTSTAAYERLVQMEHRFVKMDGLLLAGTDPTSFGGLLPGFAGLRQLTLLVKSGFSLPEAVQISTLNGARFLGRERNAGSIQTGKRADFRLIDGDPVPMALPSTRYQWYSRQASDTEGIDSRQPARQSRVVLRSDTRLSSKRASRNRLAAHPAKLQMLLPRASDSELNRATPALMK